MIIEIGNGDFEIVTVKDEEDSERFGVLLRKSAQAHPIGEFTGSGGQRYEPGGNDVLIWINKLESGRVLQDVVNLALLKIQKVPID